MAVDTRNKRASVLGFVFPLTLILPAPDAAIVQADRQHVAYSYSGISAEALSVLNLCDAYSESLMTALTSGSLMTELDSASIMPDRTSAAHCEDA